MKKNRIRLTESQLHNIIKESVRQMLSELDWKTYASAAEKSNRRYFEKGHNKKDLRRVGKFSDAAVKAFKEKYPEVVNQTDRKFDPYCNGYGMGYNAEYTYPTYNDGRKSTIKVDRTSNNMSDRVDHIIYDKDGNEEYYGRNVDSDYPYNDIEKNAVKDLDMFSRIGVLGYKKGKGWKY